MQKDLGLTTEELAYLDSHAEHGLELEVWKRASEIHAQHLTLVRARESRTD